MMIIILLIIIMIIANGNFYSTANYPCKGSLAALYNDTKT